MANSAKIALLDEMMADSSRRLLELKDRLKLEETYLSDLKTRRAVAEDEEPPPNGQERPIRPLGNQNISGHTVPDAVKAILENHGGAMRARDITAALVAAGFKTESKNGLLPSVLSALGRREDFFKKVRRGTYKLAAAAQQ